MLGLTYAVNYISWYPKVLRLDSILSSSETVIEIHTEICF